MSADITSAPEVGFELYSLSHSHAIQVATTCESSRVAGFSLCVLSTNAGDRQLAEGKGIIDKDVTAMQITRGGIASPQGLSREPASMSSLIPGLADWPGLESSMQAKIAP